MRRLVLAFAALLAAGAFAPAALATPSLATVELTGRGDRHEAPGERFTLVGLHWRGSGRVLFRTRSVDGRWSRWRDAAPEEDDGPDPGSREARLRSGWRIGSPWWVGPSDRIETRSAGRVSRVRAHLVWSPEVRIPYRMLAAAGAPPVVPRLSWGADESIRRGPPTYAPAARFAVVHHTAGGNGYTRAQAPAVVKAIQLYHVKSNGWNDIGYNFLVDRFGTIYEGRFGGIDRNVVGAHALGFNTGSVGVALLGTYGSTPPSKAAEDALARLLAWRLDVAHVDPTASSTVVSSGSERYSSGLPVLVRNVTGHRDTGRTECPGDLLYARLGSLAASANAIGLPKLYEPVVESRSRVHRFRGRFSSRLAWTVSVADGDGLEVARGTGTGTVVDWTWDAGSAEPGRYSWSIAAGSARPATGSLRVAGVQAPAVEDVVLEPEAISPNGDGQADSARLTYRLTTAMTVTVQVVDSAGAVVATPVAGVPMPAGTQSLVVDGSPLPDGTYAILLMARTAPGLELQQVASLTVNRTLGLVSVAPTLFSPNGDGRRDVLRISFSLTVASAVNVTIVRDGSWVATVHSSDLLPGPHEVRWEGSRAPGRLRDGAYSAVVEARHEAGGVAFAAPFASDTTAPKLSFVPGRRLRLRVSEPAVLTLRIDGRTVRRAVRKAGVVVILGAASARRVQVVAVDEAGNRSPPLVRVARPGRSGAPE